MGDQRNEQGIGGNRRLESRQAIITGAASGIGRAVTRRFVTEGARVVAVDHQPHGVDELAREHGPETVRTVVGDVREPDTHRRALDTALEMSGHLDSWIGVAGIHDAWTRLERYSSDELADVWRRVLDVNVLANLHGIQMVAPELRRSRGNVVLAASTSSWHAGGGGVAYVSSKHALLGAIRQLAHELAPDVRVNGVAPGVTATGLRDHHGTDLMTTLGQHGDALQAAVDPLPIPLVAEPEDHADAFVFLASGESRLITGAVIPSDGGMDVRGIVPARRSRGGAA